MSSELLFWIAGVSIGGTLVLLFGLYRLLWKPKPRQSRAAKKPQLR